MWVCAMITHHQAAIDMARTGLLGGDNAESKRLAKETIETNERGLAKLRGWRRTRSGRAGTKLRTAASNRSAGIQGISQIYGEPQFSDLPWRIAGARPGQSVYWASMASLKLGCR